VSTTHQSYSAIHVQGMASGHTLTLPFIFF